MPMEVNRHQILTMVDISATHNFVAKKMVNILGFSVAEQPSWIKVINFQA